MLSVVYLLKNHHLLSVYVVLLCHYVHQILMKMNLNQLYLLVIVFFSRKNGDIYVIFQKFISLMYVLVSFFLHIYIYYHYERVHQMIVLHYVRLIYIYVICVLYYHHQHHIMINDKIDI
jgi:hypothetical protein